MAGTTLIALSSLGFVTGALAVESCNFISSRYCRRQLSSKLSSVFRKDLRASNAKLIQISDGKRMGDSETYALMSSGERIRVQTPGFKGTTKHFYYEGMRSYLEKHGIEPSTIGKCSKYAKESDGPVYIHKEGEHFYASDDVEKLAKHIAKETIEESKEFETASLCLLGASTGFSFVHGISLFMM